MKVFGDCTVISGDSPSLGGLVRVRLAFLSRVGSEVLRRIRGLQVTYLENPVMDGCWI